MFESLLPPLCSSMKKLNLLALVMLVFATTQILGCKSQPVDKPVSKIKPSFSPAHQALLEQRKKQDGD